MSPAKNASSRFAALISCVTNNPTRVADLLLE
jgi:hypothetical protein